MLRKTNLRVDSANNQKKKKKGKKPSNFCTLYMLSGALFPLSNVVLEDINAYIDQAWQIAISEPPPNLTYTKNTALIYALIALRQCD